MTTLRDYVVDSLSNLDNPNYVPPALEPYVPPNAVNYFPRLRKTHKVYTVPPAGAPSVLSPEAKQMLDEFLASVEGPVDDAILESASVANEGGLLWYKRAKEVDEIAQQSVERADQMRDEFRYKEVMATPAEAIAKLNEIPVQGRFVVPDHMAHNMQALVSKRNKKEHGKRFKTARVNGDKSFLQVWRTR